ncbi:protein HEADING DATE 3B-like isoform X2 [Salvia miltiorrhiza]|uniref:protein HEADING DATE 3B-like isoform X2 n=1 Tax=Salvia miltiorrhiza TaxID=226208 RepID=UPI0025ABD298|nr:protein HEADING DATE 3B-like isoform X2 [Salvia miltiorrhiza]
MFFQLISISLSFQFLGDAIFFSGHELRLIYLQWCGISGILLFSLRESGMKGEKDEGKQMVPLFPGLHISDGDKGGPRAPPRNKMALFEEYSVNSQGPELRSGPRPLLPVPLGSGCTNFVSQASSSNVAGVKRKVRPVLAAMNEYPHSPEWYYSHCSGGVSGTSNYQNPGSSSGLMMKAKCISVQPPCGFSSYSNCCTDENDFGVSSFLQSGKILNYGNPQLHVKKEKLDAFSSKLSKVTKTGDQENSKLTLNNVGNRISHPSIAALQRDHLKKTSMGDDETSRLDFPQAFKNLHKSKTVADDMSALCGVASRKSTSAVDDTAHSSPRAEDCNQRANIDNDPLSLKIGDAIKREETSDTCTEDSLLGLDLATDEVVRVIGQRLFLKARKTMVHQQKIFSLQMFELHRLITRHIARSPEIFHDTTFDPSKPSIKFPPINKLLYVSPLDPSPAVAKAKVDPPKSNLGTDCGSEAICGLLPLPTTDVEKGLLAQQKPLPNPTSIPIDPKLAPWCLPVPTGNQWLVPVRSPSEGLIYKPYPGPCFPSVGFMAPVYGNCPPISLSSLGGATYGGVPPPNEQGTGGFCSTELSQSYLQPYPMPLIPSAGAQAGELDKSSSSNFFMPHQIPCKVSSQSAIVSECGGNLHRSSGSEMQGSTESSPPERLEGDALSLFPITPSLQRNEQRVQAIKAVPHNRMSASASAARIFQSIQEERRKQE